MPVTRRPAVSGTTSSLPSSSRAIRSVSGRVKKSRLSLIADSYLWNVCCTIRIAQQKTIGSVRKTYEELSSSVSKGGGGSDMFVSEMMSKCVAECTEDMGLSEV